LEKNHQEFNEMKKKIINIISTLRQLKYPREFRIEQGVEAEDWVSSLEEITDLLKKLLNTKPQISEKEFTINEDEFKTLLAETVNGIWRIRRILQTIDQNNPKERDVERLSRALDYLIDSLKENKIELVDLTGRRVVGALPFVIISIEEAEVSEEQVIETVRPSIYYNDRLIQRGQVIVGRPPKEQR
jgi:molecular chaperone GrpE (heat shock protein)